MADISSARTASSRTQTLPPPPLPRGVRDAQKAPRSTRETSRGHSSSSSQSSYASSTFDGRKRSYDSNTSLEDDRDYKSSRDRGGATSSRRARERYPQEEEEETEEEPPAGTGHGASIWNAITGIAGALTVNVSKAWEGGSSPAVDGEVTPAGQESSLTKAMKDYHLKSARSAKDLPGWLFDESELRGKREEEGGGRTSSRKKAWQTDDSRPSPRDRDKDRDEDRVAPAPRRGLRDIYDQASASPSTKSFADSRAASLSSSRDGNSSTTASSTSKASSRLKALRDTKRAASGTSGRTGYDEDAPVEVYDDRQSPSQSETPAARRVGLPTGPRRR